MPRRRGLLDAQLARADHVPVAGRLRHLAVELLGAQLVRHDRRPEALGQLLDPDDVVEVVMGEQEW